MKKYVDERYADIILQLAHKYQNENPSDKGGQVYSAMDKTLETMDKYTAHINRMGYMMHRESIYTMLEYIRGLIVSGCEFSAEELRQVYSYLINL